MPRPCSVCSHPAVEVINHALVAGEAAAAVSARYRTESGRPLGRMAMQRHRDEHVPEALAKAQEAAEVAHGDDLLAQVRSLQTRTLSILDTAETSGQLMAALAAIREARGCLELLAKLVGQLDERPVVNIVASQEWHHTRTVLLEALHDYPDARAAVAARLLSLEEATNGHR
ncbi:MAG TPA: hypothetical protein VGW38_15745 [Chloroflexota bacterium]|nr:hypothetical protein [Chloroflexota bacterium]